MNKCCPDCNEIITGKRCGTFEECKNPSCDCHIKCSKCGDTREQEGITVGNEWYCKKCCEDKDCGKVLDIKKKTHCDTCGVFIPPLERETEDLLPDGKFRCLECYEKDESNPPQKPEGICNGNCKCPDCHKSPKGTVMTQAPSTKPEPVNDDKNEGYDTPPTDKGCIQSTPVSIQDEKDVYKPTDKGWEEIELTQGQYALVDKVVMNGKLIFGE